MRKQSNWRNPSIILTNLSTFTEQKFELFLQLEMEVFSLSQTYTLKIDAQNILYAGPQKTFPQPQKKKTRKKKNHTT